MFEAHSLVLFRDLLKRPIVQSFLTLADAQSAKPEAMLDAYCSFARDVFARGGNWSRCLYEELCTDENVYVSLSVSAQPITAQMEESLTRELAILSRLAAFDGSEFRAKLNLPLPMWEVEAIDFDKEYRKRLSEIPTNGYGMFAQNHVFTVSDGGALIPVHFPDSQHLSDLHGYERERQAVIANTEALLAGEPANNVLLYGDAGTGKSSTVKAIVNEFHDRGLRLIEVKKSQLYQLPALMDALSASPLKFIVFIDDLSFSCNDNDFSALKAILEGSVAGRGANLSIYATSNQRHLIKESFGDRSGDEIHIADTIQELMSLSARFGLTVTFMRPNKDLYREIVISLAANYALVMDEEELLKKAEAHAIRNGGRSPRVAKQFVELLKSGVSV